ncbi:bck1-like resistance to osmotic shock [Coemansia sp. RSA 522]|nr:bck1-like resistance to osmotic shock [Coemansia sp. RSA 522]
MSRPPCIGIPFKKSPETDWVRPLRQYIARALQEDPDAYNSDCQVLQRMRQDMRGAKADETGRDIIYRYYSHLEALERRIRVGEHGVKMVFQWTDAFTDESIQQHSLAFEKANVIFNLAVSFAMQGAGLITDASSDMDLESIRSAFECFRVAADRFHFISKNFMHPPSMDLQLETVNALDSIMLAQAQECALIRAQLEKKKDVTVSKLAQQAALMYSGVFDGVKPIAESHHLPRGWVLLIETKLRYYQAMAQYHEARAENSKGHYGIAIARFSLAEQHAREATKLVGQFTETFFSTTNLTEDLYPENVQGLQDLVTALAANVNEELSRANRDNDIIYNDPVPNISTLPALEAAIVAYHFDIGDFYASDERTNVVGGELFTRLIPMAIHEGSSIYSEEKAKIIRAEEDKVNLADGELQDALSFMKMPESLRRFEHHQRAGPDSIASEFGELSRAVCDAAREVQSTERASSLTDMRASVEAQRVRTTEELNHMKRILDEEQRTSESALSEYASEPLFASYQPSSRAASFYREQVAENQKKLEDAAGLDNSILSDYQSVVAPWLPALHSGSEGVISVLLEHLRDVDIGDGPGSQAMDAENLVDIGQDQPVGLAGQVQIIREIYEQLLDLKSVRRSTLSELKAFARDDDISNTLVKASDAKGLQALFDRELHKYDNHIQRLQAAASRQDMLVKRISDEFRRLLELPQARSINKRWEAAEGKKAALESQVLEAVQVYHHVRDGLDKANRFYGMMLESLGPFRRQVNEFAESRASLREQLVKQSAHESASRNQAMLQERLSQYSASSHPHQPPSAQEHQQTYQPQAAQASYPPQQQYQPIQSPTARATDPYDMGHLATQAAHLSLNSPSGEPAPPPQQMQQQGYSYGGPQVPQYQPSAPLPMSSQQQPPPQQQQHYAQHQQSPPQHQYQPQQPQHQYQSQLQSQNQYQPQPQYQQPPQNQYQPPLQYQPQAQYQPPQSQSQYPQQQPPPQQAHSASGHEYPQQSVDHGYPPSNTASGQYSLGHAPPADNYADPYSATVRRSTALEPSSLTNPVNPNYKPGYGGYVPTTAPLQTSTNHPGGYGGMSGPYMSSAPEMSMSSPAYATALHGAHQQPVYGEIATSMAAQPVTHPVTAQPASNGYSSMAYPPASQAPNSSYTNAMLNSAQQPRPQMAMSTSLESHQYKVPQQQPPQQQASPYQYQQQADSQPARNTPQYGAPPVQPGSSSYQQLSYMQAPQQQYGSQPPPAQYQPPHSYGYGYSAPQYAPPVSAPYGGPSMAPQPQMQPMAPQAVPQYGYSQPPGYAPSPVQHQQQQHEQQYQHGYGGNAGSLMD